MIRSRGHCNEPHQKGRLDEAGQLGQYCRDRLRVRDHAVIVEILAKRGMAHSDAARAEGDFASFVSRAARESRRGELVRRLAKIRKASPSRRD
jgi:hypothetical protein